MHILYIIFLKTALHETLTEEYWNNVLNCRNVNGAYDNMLVMSIDGLIMYDNFRGDNLSCSHSMM